MITDTYYSSVNVCSQSDKLLILYNHPTLISKTHATVKNTPVVIRRSTYIKFGPYLIGCHYQTQGKQVIGIVTPFLCFPTNSQTIITM